MNEEVGAIPSEPDPSVASEGISIEGNATPRPDYIPEKFWDADGEEPKVEELGRGYLELERYVGKKRDEIREEVVNQYNQELNVNRPEAADKYVASFSEESPFHKVQDDIDYEDPLIKLWQETSYKAGLSQNEFSTGVETYLTNSIPQVDQQAELAKLGENGVARMEAVEMWASKNLEEHEYNAMAAMATSAESIMALEKLMKANNSTVRQTFGEDTVSVKPDRTDLNTAMNDPRYWDPAKRDEGYVRKVENMAKRMVS